MKRVLPAIVISQFFCTSVWFAGSAVIGDIAKELRLGTVYLGYLASAVQFGFIAGTLLFAMLSIADRFRPTVVFCTCAILASIVNLPLVFNGIQTYQVIAFRFLTGFFLAGIYPVGMKIASDHYRHGLGRSLGYLVGALVLGTAFPHLLKSLPANIPWKFVIICTSLLSAIGGLIMYFVVPDGEHKQAVQKINLLGFLTSFKDRRFRSFALGYFGHMWELYAFWLFVPLMIKAYSLHNPSTHFNVAQLSFFIIAAGSISCILSGLLSQSFGSKKIATIALTVSLTCCILSPLFMFTSSAIVFVVFLLVWSMAVIADSPLFSTLVAQYATPQFKGTSLTIVNCIGYCITIVSIQLINALYTAVNAQYIYMLLGVGPLLGLLALSAKNDKAE
jgi:MFS family permease